MRALKTAKLKNTNNFQCSLASEYVHLFTGVHIMFFLNNHEKHLSKQKNEESKLFKYEAGKILIIFGLIQHPFSLSPMGQIWDTEKIPEANGSNMAHPFLEG